MCLQPRGRTRGQQNRGTRSEGFKLNGAQGGGGGERPGQGPEPGPSAFSVAVSGWVWGLGRGFGSEHGSGEVQSRAGL